MSLQFKVLTPSGSRIGEIKHPHDAAVLAFYYQGKVKMGRHEIFDAAKNEYDNAQDASYAIMRKVKPRGDGLGYIPV